jgi:arsenate reductase-like glutaredoxin family protein
MKSTRKDALAHGDNQYFTGKPCNKGHVAARRAKTGECIECRAIALKKWREKNPQQVQKHNTKQYELHSEKLKAKSKAYYASNTEAISQRSKAYQRANLHKFAAVNAKREAAKLQRTPAWLTIDDLWMISQAYELAKLREQIVGGKWHVDHVVPLQGKTVSGLHVPINLQVIPAKQNRSKSNAWEV